MTAFSPDPGDSCVGAVSIPPAPGSVSSQPALASFPGRVLWGSCGLRGLWAGIMIPRLCDHPEKEGAQESMESVLWSRLGARARGTSGPLPVLTRKMTFRATLRPSLLCSFHPEHLENGQGGGGMVAHVPLGEHEKEGPLPCSSLLSPGILSAKGRM